MLGEFLADLHAHDGSKQWLRFISIDSKTEVKDGLQKSAVGINQQHK